MTLRSLRRRNYATIMIDILMSKGGVSAIGSCDA